MSDALADARGHGNGDDGRLRGVGGPVRALGASSMSRILYGLATLAALIVVLRAVRRKLERKVLRREVERVLEVVEELRKSSDIIFKGEGTAVDLDRGLSGLLEVPEKTVIVSPGIEVVDTPSALRKGKGGSIDRVLEYFQHPKQRESATPFDVRLETGSGTFYLRGAVLCLGRPALSSKPSSIALIGVGRREEDADPVSRSVGWSRASACSRCCRCS